MRISTVMMQQFGVEAILERQSSLSYTERQLALGKRIISPSDDPIGATTVLALEQEEKLTAQYQSNIGRAISQLRIEEGLLASFGNTLQRIREIAVQGLNSASIGPQNALAMSYEVFERLDELLSLANTRDGNGDYLFSGYKGETLAVLDAGGGVYVYQGDQGTKKVQISKTRQAATGDNGFEIFFDLPFSGGGKQDIFKTVYDFAVALQTNTLGTAGNELTDLDTAMDRLYSVRAEIGARLHALDGQQEINTQSNIQIKTTMSEIQDLDYAEAISRFNLELTGLQASQQSFQKIQNLSLFNYL